MNLRSKWCLFGLLSWAAMAGIAGAQESPGSVRLGTSSAEELPPPITSLNDGVGQVNLGSDMGYTKVDRQFRPRFNIDTRGGGLYGYNPGYTNVGMFVPFAIEEDSAIVFLDGRGMITHDGKGGASLGTGWRWWQEDIDRIIGLSAWFDYDNGHRTSYSQFGVSLESLGRYVDYRINGYIPVGTRSTMLSSTVDPTDIRFLGNNIVFGRTNVAEQTYTGFDAEVGGPLPVLGRYGVNGYLGGYHFMGNGVASGSFTGVSGRFMAQINEDLQFGVQVTDDHVFGTNTQFQIFVTLPEGAPSRWLRNPRVQDRLTESVYRQYRVMAHTETFSTFDLAIDPKDGIPYFVTHIDPNLGPVGNGTFENPFHSIAVYNGQPLAAQQQSDIIYVRPRADGTNTNLDTAPTFTVYNGQRLLSTSVPHTFLSANFPGVVHNLPGFVPDLLPMLVNSAGGDVITLAPGNVQPIEVSGFDIQGSAGGSGIAGTNNTFVLINRNEIHDGFNGIDLVNLTDGAGSSIITTNILRDNVNDGFHLLNLGGPSVTTLQLLNNTAFGNGDDGFDIAADIGSTVGGLIDGNTTVSAAGGSPNGDTGLTLSSNGGFLAFNNPLALPVAQQISNNIFSDNSGDGVFIDVIGGGNGDVLFLANTIGNNGGAGIHVPASDASLINLVVGGPDDVLDRNNITGNGGPGILFDLSNTANGVTTRIENNVISGNLDGIQINVADASVFGPAVGANFTEIFDNEITGNRRDGIRLTRSDFAVLDLGTPAAPPIHNNNISSNTENGLSVIAEGFNTVLGVPDVILATQDNVFDSNALDGLNIFAGETAGLIIDDVLVNFDSNRDQFTTNGQHGLNITSTDLTNINTNLVNVTATANVQNGLNTLSQDGGLPGTGSGQVINVFAPIDPLFIGTSTFSNNGANGIANTSDQNSTTIVNLNPNNENEINLEGNGQDGWHLNRLDTSLILASAQNATFSNNGGDGIEFSYTGSPPTDPNQPQPVAPPPYLPLAFLPNQLIVNNIIADGNGGNGLNTLGAADATLLVNATLSSFTNNTLNGILITTELGSSFGNIPAPGSPQSVFDALTITGNSGDGIHIDENRFFATGSKVFLEVNTTSGNTDISNNGGDGVHAESDGDQTNILLHSTAGNLLTINSNAVNGVRWDVTSDGDAIGHLFTIDDVTIDGNGGDGIQFNVPTGTGTMVVTNNRVLNSGDDGINVNLTALDNPTGFSFGLATIIATDNLVDGSNGHGVNLQIQGGNNEAFFDPTIIAIFTGTAPETQQILNSGLNGVNIEIRGVSGDRFDPNTFYFENNRIALSGTRNVFDQSHGIFFESNAGRIIQFGGFQDRRFIYDDLQNPPAPINTFPISGSGQFNTPYLDLSTDVNSTLQIVNNTIEFNGTAPTAPGEGVFIRVSTNSYVSSDVSGNTFTGNGAADFRTESFVATDALGNPVNTLTSTQVNTPGNDTLFLDHTAQLDLQFSNNTGENIDPVTAFAVMPGEPAKGNFNRSVSLFQVDNVPGGPAGELNTTNTFTALPAGQTVFTLFLNDFDNLTTVTPWSLNNPAFPQDFVVSPGNPFLP